MTDESKNEDEAQDYATYVIRTRLCNRGQNKCTRSRWPQLFTTEVLKVNLKAFK